MSNRNKLIDTKNILMGGALGEWVKKVKRLRTPNWLLQNSHGDVKCSMGNTVNNVVITVCGVRRVWIYQGDSFKSYTNV